MKVSPSKSVQRAKSTLLLLNLLLDPCPSLLCLWRSWWEGAPVDWDGIGSLRGWAPDPVGIVLVNQTFTKLDMVFSDFL